MSSLTHAIERHPAGSALSGRTRPGTTARTTQRPELRLVPAPQPRPHVRLTRRGRLAVLLTGLLVTAAALLALGPSVGASDATGAPVPTTTVTVQRGQTLWDIAAATDPEGDIRDTVRQIVALNSLPSAGSLQIGAELAVPAA